MNNPIMYADPSGCSAIVAFILCASILLILRCDSYQTYESSITIDDLNINGTNPEGTINITINEDSIEITDSKNIRKDEDIERVLELIIDSDVYKSYNYERFLESYKLEWKAHTFAYCLFPFGKWGKRTRSVNLDKNEEEDIYRFIYWIF